MTELKLNQLELFVAVVQAGSFSAAAIELGCTQSRVSHGVAELERVVGVRLLHRARSGCQPTEAGQRVLLKARQMLRMAESVVSLAQEDAGLVGRVRLACFRSMAEHIVPDVLAALARDYPGIQVEVEDGCVDSLEVNQAMAQGRVDVGISSFYLDKQWLQWPFLHDDYVLVLPTEWARVAQPLTWEHLQAWPYIESRNVGSGLMREQCAAHGFAPQRVRRLVSDSSVLAQVKRGMGYSIMPQLAAFPAQAGIVCAPLPMPLHRPFVVVAQPDSMRHPAVKRVLRYLRDKRILRSTEAYRAGVVQLDG
jgi:DNA-binding transcriptional LysR family regulator